jgi:hypothetical protein
MNKIAVKRLTASDLTFFEWHFRNRNAGNQKAVNLNRDTFVDKLFPVLPEIAMKSGGRIPIDLWLFGPGLKGALNLQRKIVKFGEYKNWRLDGEFIFNPVEDSERFNVLKPGDVAVLEFIGEGVPSTIRAAFLAQDVNEDKAVRAALDQYLGTRSMAAITVQELAKALEGAKIVDTHPLKQFVIDSAVEDTALGGIEGPRRLRASGRKLSREELLQAKAAAEECGLRGEELIDAYLASLKAKKTITAYEWIANDDNAVAPYDFKAEFSGKPKPTFIEVKATRGEFERNIHISMNELLAMASEDEYHLLRVYELADEAAKLRIATEVRGVAKKLLSIFEQLPKGVTVDGVSVKPGVFSFAAEISIQLTEAEDEGGEVIQAKLF